MKKIVVILIAFCSLTAVAQNRSTIETRALTNSLRQSKGVAGVSKMLMNQLPIQREADQLRIGVLAKVDSRFDKQQAERLGIRVSSRVADIVTMHVPLEVLPSLETLDGITLYSVAHHAAADMNNTRVDTRTDSVQAGLGVPMPFNGEGVLIGITDWGFDYMHPNINPKSAPRILRAWDQFRSATPHPAGFDYGTEFVGYDDLKEAHGDTSGLYGYATHGTHVAGICGGNGRQGNAVGQAPGAMFLLGSWYLDEAHWLDQVAWMKSVADAEGKRLVINSSWGMYTFSTLDGTSLLSQAINAYADSGIVFVTSGGNNGDDRFHLQRTFAEGDTLRSVAAWYNSGIGQGLIYWGEPGADKQFKAGFELVNSADTNIRVYSPLFATEDNIEYTESFVAIGTDTVRYNVMTESSNPLDGRPHVLLNVSKKGAYKLIMRCIADAGTTVHVWNMANIANGAGNMGCSFSSSGIYGCQNGDDYYGIGEPACAEKTLSVAAHTGDRYRSSDSSYITGGIASFSSYGPTLDGRNKPEVSAPGVNVVSSISSWSDEINNYTAVYEQITGSRRYIWSTMSGTSMSSPAVTGIAALMLQANPHLTSDQVREILMSTSRNDDKTGPLHANDSMSVRWGWGKVDALRAVNAAYDRLGIEEAIANQPQLVVYPNPTTGLLTLRTGSDQPERMELFTIDGHLVMQQQVSSEATIDLGALAQGVYFVRVHDRTGVRTAKVVVSK